MLVDIIGHAYIPGTDLLAPQYGYDATEAFIRRMMNFSEWRVYQTSTKRLITPKNVDSFFDTGGGGGGTTPAAELNWELI